MALASGAFKILFVGIGAAAALILAMSLWGQSENAAFVQTARAERSAAIVPQFDLICAGALFIYNQRKEPFKDRFRIDLDGRKWCREGCERIFPIARIEPGYLKLSIFDNNGDGNSLSIDRVSGELYGEVKIDTLESTTFATCKAAPFSQFPATKF